MRGRRTRRAVWWAATLCLAAMLLPAAGPAQDQGNGKKYLEELQRGREESWFRREVRRYSSYGHLDRAYRRLNSGDAEGAADDMRHFLGEEPDNREVRRSLVVVLYRLGRTDEVLKQTAIMLVAEPDDPQILLVRAQALRAVGRVDDAVGAFWKLAALKTAEPSDRAFALGSIVDIAYAEKRWDLALKALDAEARESDDFTVHFRRGLLLENVDSRRAAEAYAKALERAQSDPERLQAELAIAEAAVKRRDVATAKKAFLAASELDPKSARIFRALSDLSYAEKDYPGAAEWRRRVLALEPTLADREFLANVLLKGGDPAGAAVEIERQLGEVTEPEERHRLFLRLGNAYGAAGKHAEATKAFEEALAIRQDAESLAAVAVAAERAGQLDAAIRHLEEVARQKPSAEIQLRIGVLYARLKKRDEAVAALRRALEGKLSRSQRAFAYEQIGYLLDAGKHYREARDALANAAALNPRPDLLRALAELDLRAEAPEEAAKHLAKSLEGAPSSPATARGYERLGHLYVKLEKYPEAADAFQRALATGRGDGRIHQHLGNVLFEMGRWQEALGEFQAAARGRPTARGLVQIARCYEKLGKPGLAIHFMERALPGIGTLTREEQKALYDALSLLYAAESQNDRAAEACQKSLAVAKDPEIELRLGTVLLAQGKIEEAWERLDRMDAQSLPPARQANRLDALAQIHRRESRFGEAILTLEEAIRLTPAPEREYQMGLCYRDLGRSREAVDHLERAFAHFEKAHEEDPANNRYAEALGYAYQDIGRPHDAIPLFEGVLARDPDYLRLYEDLGYLYMQAVDNDTAVEWFHRALDNRPLYPIHSDEEKVDLDRRLETLQKELLKVNRHFDFTAYLSLRDEDLPEVQTPAGLAGGALRSQGGVELAWRPPKIGFRDERILQVFGRVLWNVKPNSLDFEDDSYQGGVGLRYKPLKVLNLWGSVERLFSIGDDADDNWLLRGLYSFDDGFDLEPGKRLWNYSFLFGDIAYRTERPNRGWSYFLEGRQGITLNFGDHLLVSPHLMADARYEDPYKRAGSYVEMGPGASFRLLINRPGYERSSIELLTHYRFGEFLSKELGTSGDGFDGWVVTGIVRF